MEFWIGIILDTICLAIALFMAINPKGFARGMKYQSVRQTKIFRIVGIIAVAAILIALILNPDEPGSDTGIRR